MDTGVLLEDREHLLLGSDKSIGSLSQTDSSWDLFLGGGVGSSTGAGNLVGEGKTEGMLRGCGFLADTSISLGSSLILTSDLGLGMGMMVFGSGLIGWGVRLSSNFSGLFLKSPLLGLDGFVSMGVWVVGAVPLICWANNAILIIFCCICAAYCLWNTSAMWMLAAAGFGGMNGRGYGSGPGGIIGGGAKPGIGIGAGKPPLPAASPGNPPLTPAGVMGVTADGG